MDTPTAKIRSKRLTKTLFFLTAYSLTGAAFMGSSIGLVIFQSRQFLFLSQASHPGSDLMPSPPPLPPNFYDSYTAGGRLEVQAEVAATASNPYHRYHDRYRLYPQEYPSPPSFIAPHSFQSSIFSNWLPVLVWLGCLLASSTLISSQKWVPRLISPRTGILSSQFIFALFWIILGAIQEVQERLLVQNNTLTGVDVIQDAMEDGVTMDKMLETSQRIQVLMVPLCTAWYMAVMLLGGTTGLLTVSSSLLEKQVEEAHRDTQMMLTLAGDEDDDNVQEQCLLEKQDIEKQRASDAPTTPATTPPSSPSPSPKPRFTAWQYAALVLLVLSLFISQMKLFHWIVRTQSTIAVTDKSITSSAIGTSTKVMVHSVSSCLTAVGLLSGTVMISLGTRLLPRVASTP